MAAWTAGSRTASSSEAAESRSSGPTASSPARTRVVLPAYQDGALLPVLGIPVVEPLGL